MSEKSKNKAKFLTSDGNWFGGFFKRNEFSRPDKPFNNYLRMLFSILSAGGFHAHPDTEALAL